MYLQRQKKDLCRMHAINNFYQGEVLSEKKFLEYCLKFDKHYQVLNSREYSYFIDGDCLISFILREISGLKTKIVYGQEIKKYQFKDVFVFNYSHIWVRKYINGQWYNFDSLSGISQIKDPYSGLGFIFIQN